MPNMFANDLLQIEAFGEPVRSSLVQLVGVRIKTRCVQFDAGHLLFAATSSENALIDRVLQPALLCGQTRQDLSEILLSLCSTPEGMPTPPRPLSRDSFTPDAQQLLEMLARDFPPECRFPAPEDGFARMLTLICQHLPPEKANIVGYVIEVAKLGTSVRGTATAAMTKVEFFRPDGTFPFEGVTSEVLELLRAAMHHAARTGYAECFLFHFVLAFFEGDDSVLEQTLRVFGRGARLRDAREQLVERVQKSVPGPPLHERRDAFSRAGRIFLDRCVCEFPPFGVAELFLRLLENLDLDPTAHDGLCGTPLQLDLAAAQAFLKRSLHNRGEKPRLSQTAKVPSSLADLENLSQLASGPLRPKFMDRSERGLLERALSARDARCVIVHGLEGTGRSSLVEHVAQRAAAGESPFLKGAVFLRLDAGKIDESARAACFRRLVSAVEETPSCLVVVENFHLLIAADSTPLRKLGDTGQGCLIGVTTTAAYQSRIASQSAGQAGFWTIEVGPPSHDQTLKILDAMVPVLEQRFQVSVSVDDLERISQLADRHLAQWQRPKRNVQLLQWACDEAQFDNSSRSGQPVAADRTRAAKVLARRLGISENEFLSHRPQDYYLEELQRRVIGQPEAVAAAAESLMLAKHAARTSERPAAILLFAGVTGCGKTLLAEELAKLFSPKGTMHKFEMGGFLDQTTVTRFTGASPGYMGYEEGGGLVNRLLAEPRAVLLFDEIEKAYPEVWHVCLNLFDKGRVSDAQFREATATESLIVLTTNLGQDAIAEGVRRGLRFEEIERQTIDAIRNARRPRTNEPYFAPEFFGRLSRIIVFRPVDHEMFRRIAVLEIEKVVRANREERSLQIESTTGNWDDLADVVAEQCHHRPDHGRALDKLLKEMLVLPVTALHVRQPELRGIRVSIDRRAGVLMRLTGSRDEVLVEVQISTPPVAQPASPRSGRPSLASDE